MRTERERERESFFTGEHREVLVIIRILVIAEMIHYKQQQQQQLPGKYPLDNLNAKRIFGIFNSSRSFYQSKDVDFIKCKFLCSFQIKL